ncbi:hypothetical protein EHS13_25050 [Paenibacillus psychroresistens]|uniref:Uncharacterized protein n=1 Tax=Paenibacillus psychroresistens TaxID=1778678 RepID=A0A6B8RQE6_9BACL|nr:hypothetical protein [Paenibacillus psychroresistens]QGQ97922.1 hypothetical protein EHS13_25050 [Paenibacillus psychroresistens]
MEVLKDIVTGVVVPIVAIIIGAWVTRKVSRDESARNDVLQRIKILHLAKQELELNLEYIGKDGVYRSRKLAVGDLLINSHVFTVSKHKNLLEYTLEVIRQHEMLEISLQTHLQMYSNLAAEQFNPTFLKTLGYGLEKMLKLEPTLERNTKIINESMQKTLRESSIGLKPAYEQMLQEVNILLLDKSNIET